MKKLLIITALVAFYMGSLMAQKQFEGDLVMTTSDDEKKVQFVIKGEKVKMIPEMEEEDGESPEIIIDGTTGDMIVMGEKNGKPFAIKLNLNEDSPMGAAMKLQMNQHADVEEDVDHAINSLEKIGTERLHGYLCDIFRGRNDDGETFKVWMTKELNLSMADLFPIGGTATNPIKEKFGAIGMEGIPLKVVVEGEEDEAFEITPKPRSVSDDELNVPSNLEVLDMSNILMELMQAQGDPDKMKEIQEKMKLFEGMNEH